MGRKKANIVRNRLRGKGFTFPNLDLEEATTTTVAQVTLVGTLYS